MENSFDLHQFLLKVEDSVNPQQLYEMWNWVSTQFEKGCISGEEREEIREKLFPRINQLSQIQRGINAAKSSGG